MDTVLIIVFIPATVLCVLLGIGLLLYVVPLQFLVSFIRKGDRQETTVTVSWNCVSIRIKPSAGKNEIEVLVAGHRVTRVNLSPPGPPPVPESPTKTARSGREEIRTAEDLIFLIRHVIEPVKKIGVVVYQQSSFENIRGTVRIGLGDPVATGMLYGGYWATRFMFSASRISIDLTPDFERQVLEMELSVRFGINHPLRILITSIQVMVSRDVRESISGFWQKNRVMQ